MSRVFTIDTDGRHPDAIAHDGSYYAHIGPWLADRVDTLLPAVPTPSAG
jgi:hypothetical protein